MCAASEGSFWIFHCTDAWIKNRQDLSFIPPPAFLNSDMRSELSESECRDLLCTSCTAAALTEALAPSSVCRLPSCDITASAGGRGGGTRLMMVLTAYISSGWRVMRHLSNLNIFHWAVMALSSRPHVRVCVCGRARASLEVHLNVNHICIRLWWEKVRTCKGTSALRHQAAAVNAQAICPGKNDPAVIR